MVFLTKVKNVQKSAEITMPSDINESFNQMRATDLSAILFKGNFKFKKKKIYISFEIMLESNVKGPICMTFQFNFNGIKLPFKAIE